MAKYFNLHNKSFYNENAAVLTPVEEYEAVFTCPPYHNVEIYSEKGSENLSYPDFLNWWKDVIIASCINKDTCKYFAFIINHTYKEDMKQICIDLGLHLNKEIKLGPPNQINHLQPKDSVKGEFLYVFSK